MVFADRFQFTNIGQILTKHPYNLLDKAVSKNTASNQLLKALLFA
jgi:hypothetical protein